MKHAFTIDVEDWYQGIELPVDEWKGKEYRLNKGLDIILQLLSEADTKGTFFALGWVAQHHPEVIKKIASEGHEIGSHGYGHSKVYDLTPAEFRDEMKRTKGLLEDAAGTAVKGHRSAYFSITRKSLWALEVLKETGFEYDCSISPVETWRYGISSSPETIYRVEEIGIIEFPVSTFPFFGKKLGLGGAYFRIFPYFIFKNAFNKKSKHNCPGMFYVHPWEFDPTHPVLSIGWKARLTHYFNLRATEGRTKRLLMSVPFAKVDDVIKDAISSNSVPDLSLKTLES